MRYVVIAPTGSTLSGARVREAFGSKVFPINASAWARGGQNFDNRLRAIEIKAAKIEQKLEHTVLHEDVLNLKIWILGGVVGGMVTAAAIGASIAAVAARFVVGP